MAWRQWTSGQLVTAPDFQSYVQDQAVLNFATTAARTAAIPSPVEGMVSYLADIDQYQAHDGTQWYPVAGKVPYGRLTWGGPAGLGGTFGFIALAPTTQALQGGMTQTTGVITVPTAGLYQVSLRLVYSAFTGSGVLGSFISDGAGSGPVGAGGARIPASSATGQPATIASHALQFASGAKVALGYDVSGVSALSMAEGQLTVTYLGRA